MITSFFTTQTHQLYNIITAKMSIQEKRSLDAVLTLTLYEVMAEGLPLAKRPEALNFLERNDANMTEWLDHVAPHLSLAIKERLFRTVLSLSS